MPVDAELQELVNSINIMSEKLESYDKAQKTFSKMPPMSSEPPYVHPSYAEGIKYDVVDKNTAADIIIDETKRMTTLWKICCTFRALIQLRKLSFCRP